MQKWEVYTKKRTQKVTDSDLLQARRRQRRELIPYICGFSRGDLNVRVKALTSNSCSEATNIGNKLSSLAVFGGWSDIRNLLDKKI